VAYLRDLFCFLNELSLSLQGANINIFKVHEKIEATIKKRRLWTQLAEKGNFKSFLYFN
jgi:3-methyladenine DNA glycosylase Tag